MTNTTPHLLPPGRLASSYAVCAPFARLARHNQNAWVVDSLDALRAYILATPGPWLITVKQSKPGRTATALHAATRQVLRAQNLPACGVHFKHLARAFPQQLHYIDPAAVLDEDRLAELLATARN